MATGAALLWLDMEMTGLDVEKEVPIEVAAIVTDWNMAPLEEYHAVIQQPPRFLDAMDDWNKKHHGESGLLAMVPGGAKPETVDAELAALVEKHFGADNKALLAGNSIGQDRLFIKRYMPRLEARLHYRLLDVTAFKIIFNNVFDKKFKKKDSHRAVDDIRESMAELQYYMSFVKG